jgi:cytochrome c-type biogenesis protein CcmF
VGEPYFNKTFVPIAIGLIYLCAFGTALKWKKDNVEGLFKKYRYPIILSIVFTGIVYWKDNSVSEALTILSCGLLLSILAQQMVTRFNKNELPMIIAHAGMAILALAIMFVSLFTDKVELMMKKGDKTEVAGFEIVLWEISEGEENNYAYRRGILEVKRNDVLIANLTPEMRVYPIEQQTTNEVSIMRHNLISDLYAVIGEKNKDEAYAVRVYFKPFVNLIWLGFLMIAAGGMMRLVLKIRIN